MSSEIDAVRSALKTVPGIPCEGEAPVFAEPWQAQAFAMALTLQQRGVFSWNEWADELGHQIKSAIAEGDPDDGVDLLPPLARDAGAPRCAQGHRVSRDPRSLL